MSDEGKLSEEMARGSRAQAILDNELVKEALEAVKEHFNVQFLNSQSSETEFRDLCYRSIKAADLFYQFFEKQVSSGKLAEKELEMIRKNKSGFIGGKADPYGAII